MEVCKHILITSNIEIKKDQIKCDELEFKSYNTYFCVKCGQSIICPTVQILDEETKEVISNIDNIAALCDDISDDSIESEYDCVCDKDLAIGIYSRIIKQYPNLDDDVALKYLKSSLNHIRTKQKTEEVQKKRIKRLGLHPKFNRWQIIDIIQS